MITTRILSQIALTGAVSLASTSLIGAAIIGVDFGGDYTATNINASIAPTVTTVDADFDGFENDRAAIVPFGTIFSPPNSPSWTTPSGKSGGVIKHGISVANINSLVDPGIGTGSESAPRTSSRLGMQLAPARCAWPAPTTGRNRVSSMGRMPSLGYRLPTKLVASLSLSTIQERRPTMGGRLSRVLVESDGSWYVSASVFGGTTGSISFNGATTNWYVFDPQVGTLFWDVATPGSPILGSTLTDITALGVYVQHALIDGTTAILYFMDFPASKLRWFPSHRPMRCVWVA
jgi:hypothetical protein